MEAACPEAADPHMGHRTKAKTKATEGLQTKRDASLGGDKMAHAGEILWARSSRSTDVHAGPQTKWGRNESGCRLRCTVCCWCTVYTVQL
jgi:hypothetical protein